MGEAECERGKWNWSGNCLPGAYDQAKIHTPFSHSPSLPRARAPALTPSHCRAIVSAYSPKELPVAVSYEYQAYMGQSPARIPHWEYLGCPDAETAITGIDYFAHPRLCLERLKTIYPLLNVDIPATDAPKPRPRR